MDNNIIKWSKVTPKVKLCCGAISVQRKREILEMTHKIIQWSKIKPRVELFCDVICVQGMSTEKIPEAIRASGLNPASYPIIYSIGPNRQWRIAQYDASLDSISDFISFPRSEDVRDMALAVCRAKEYHVWREKNQPAEAFFRDVSI